MSHIRYYAIQRNISPELLELALKFEKFCLDREIRDFFYTGSVVYGPAPCHDVDIVIDRSYRNIIEDHFASEGYEVKPGTYFGSLRIYKAHKPHEKDELELLEDFSANLNIIFTTSVKDREAWGNATHIMQAYFLNIKDKGRKLMVFENLRTMLSLYNYGD
jgi:hypothetical protein